MKLTIKRKDLELDINIEELVKSHFLYKESTDNEITEVVESYLSGLDDEYYYNITEEQADEILEEVKNYIENMEDYTLSDVCKDIIETNPCCLYIDTGNYQSVNIIPILKYLIKKEEEK